MTQRKAKAATGAKPTAASATVATTKPALKPAVPKAKAAAKKPQSAAASESNAVSAASASTASSSTITPTPTSASKPSSKRNSTATAPTISSKGKVNKPSSSSSIQQQRALSAAAEAAEKAARVLAATQRMEQLANYQKWLVKEEKRKNKEQKRKENGEAASSEDDSEEDEEEDEVPKEVTPQKKKKKNRKRNKKSRSSASSSVADDNNAIVVGDSAPIAPPMLSSSQIEDIIPLVEASPVAEMHAPIEAQFHEEDKENPVIHAGQDENAVVPVAPAMQQQQQGKTLAQGKHKKHKSSKSVFNFGSVDLDFPPINNGGGIMSSNNLLVNNVQLIDGRQLESAFLKEISPQNVFAQSKGFVSAEKKKIQPMSQQQQPMQQQQQAIVRSNKSTVARKAWNDSKAIVVVASTEMSAAVGAGKNNKKKQQAAKKQQQQQAKQQQEPIVVTVKIVEERVPAPMSVPAIVAPLPDDSSLIFPSITEALNTSGNPFLDNSFTSPSAGASSSRDSLAPPESFVTGRVSEQFTIPCFHEQDGLEVNNNNNNNNLSAIVEESDLVQQQQSTFVRDVKSSPAPPVVPPRPKMSPLTPRSVTLASQLALLSPTQQSQQQPQPSPSPRGGQLKFDQKMQVITPAIVVGGSDANVPVAPPMMTSGVIPIAPSLSIDTTASTSDPSSFASPCATTVPRTPLASNPMAEMMRRIGTESAKKAQLRTPQRGDLVLPVSTRKQVEQRVNEVRGTEFDQVMTKIRSQSVVVQQAVGGAEPCTPRARANTAAAACMSPFEQVEKMLGGNSSSEVKPPPLPLSMMNAGAGVSAAAPFPLMSAQQQRTMTPFDAAEVSSSKPTVAHVAAHPSSTYIARPPSTVTTASSRLSFRPSTQIPLVTPSRLAHNTSTSSITEEGDDDDDLGTPSVSGSAFCTSSGITGGMRYDHDNAESPWLLRPSMMPHLQRGGSRESPLLTLESVGDAFNSPQHPLRSVGLLGGLDAHTPEEFRPVEDKLAAQSTWIGSARSPLVSDHLKRQADLESALAVAASAEPLSPITSLSTASFLSRPYVQQLCLGVQVQRLTRGGLFGSHTKSCLLKLVAPWSSVLLSRPINSQDWMIQWETGSNKSIHERQCILAYCTLLTGVNGGGFVLDGDKKTSKKYAQLSDRCFSLCARLDSESGEPMCASIDVICSTKEEYNTWVNTLRAIMQS